MNTANKAGAAVPPQATHSPLLLKRQRTKDWWTHTFKQWLIVCIQWRGIARWNQRLSCRGTPRQLPISQNHLHHTWSLTISYYFKPKTMKFFHGWLNWLINPQLCDTFMIL
jgi:hypothetical protein